MLVINLLTVASGYTIDTFDCKVELRIVRNCLIHQPKSLKAMWHFKICVTKHSIENGVMFDKS
jgi:hypothetical protein